MKIIKKQIKKVVTLKAKNGIELKIRVKYPEKEEIEDSEIELQYWNPTSGWTHRADFILQGWSEQNEKEWTQAVIELKVWVRDELNFQRLME